MCVCVHACVCVSAHACSCSRKHISSIAIGLYIAEACLVHKTHIIIIIITMLLHELVMSLLLQ